MMKKLPILLSILTFSIMTSIGYGKQVKASESISSGSTAKENQLENNLIKEISVSAQVNSSNSTIIESFYPLF